MSVPASVAAATTIGPQAKNPLVTTFLVPAIDTTPKAIGASKKGRCFRQTDQLQTTKTPTFTFEVKKETRLSFRLDAKREPGDTTDRRWACLNLFFPDKTVLSKSPKKGELITDTFPPGTYRLHVAFNKSTPKHYWAKQFEITFIDPSRPSDDAPKIAFGPNFSNPMAVAVTPGPATTQASSFGMTISGCRGMTSAFPSMSFEVAAPTRAKLVAGGKKFMVRTPDNKWFCKEYGQPLNTTFAAGLYQMWVLSKPGVPVTAVLYDDERPPQYEAEKTKVGPITKPVWIQKKLKPRAKRPFESSCYAWFGRQPDLLLETARPLRDLRIKVVDPTERLQLNVEGPLAKARVKLKKQCDRVVSRKVGDGTYAVFVSAKGNGPPPDDFLLLVTDASTEVEPLTLLPSYPKDGALPLAERSFRTWFPFIPNKQPRVDTDEGVALQTRLFLEAPKSMFVFPKYDLDDVAVSERDLKRRVELPKQGEPLLLVRAARHDRTDARHTVLSADGEYFSVLVSALTESSPGPAKWPKGVRRAREVEDHYELHKIAKPKDKKAIDKFYKMSRKADDCWNRFWKKHHGGTNAQLYTVQYRNGKVVGVSDFSAKIRKRADRKCRVSKVAAYHAKLTKRLNKAFHARRNDALRKVRSRFD